MMLVALRPFALSTDAADTWNFAAIALIVSPRTMVYRPAFELGSLACGVVVTTVTDAPPAVSLST